MKYTRPAKRAVWVLKIVLFVSLLAGFAKSLMAQSTTTAEQAIKEKAYSFDYAHIEAHPRLLLNQQEQVHLLQAIKQNKPYQLIDAHLKKVADDIIAEPPLIFKKEGKRLLAVSREALTRLYYLSYAYRMTGERKYLNRAEKELLAVCRFDSWNPSHFLDVGEMCMAVAIGYDWLYADLKESTKKLVRNAIIHKAIVPSYNKKEAWFLTSDNNWNSVCNAGLVFGALAIMEDEKEAAIAIIERAIKTNRLPLNAYAPDGNYPEGPGYWNYGTSFEVMLCAALESALGSDGGLSQAPGFMQTPYYMLYAAGPSGYFFNYSDCGKAASASPALFWFARKLKDPSLVYHELDLINNGVYTKVQDKEVERLLPNALVLGKGLDLSAVNMPVTRRYSGQGKTPVSIVRTDWQAGKGLYLGIKGGKAGESHGHMDQGSFVFDADGLRWAMDFGMQNYITMESRGVDLWNMSQHSGRWRVFRYNNLNHNTLTINHQRHNVKGKAELLKTIENDGEAGALFNLAPALNLNQELKKATRRATIVNKAYLKIEDVLQPEGEAVELRWNMVTPAKAKIIDNHTIALTQKGKTMYLSFQSTAAIKLAIRPSENPANYICEYDQKKYDDYNQPNKGTVMVGFDATLDQDKETRFVAVLSPVPPGQDQ